MELSKYLDLNYIQLFSVTAAHLLNMARTKVTKSSSDEIPSSTIFGIGYNERNIEIREPRHYICSCSSLSCCSQPDSKDCPCRRLRRDCRLDCPCCVAAHAAGVLDNRRWYHFSQSPNSDVYFFFFALTMRRALCVVTVQSIRVSACVVTVQTIRVSVYVCHGADHESECVCCHCAVHESDCVFLSRCSPWKWMCLLQRCTGILMSCTVTNTYSHSYGLHQDNKRNIWIVRTPGCNEHSIGFLDWGRQDAGVELRICRCAGHQGGHGIV